MPSMVPPEAGEPAMPAGMLPAEFSAPELVVGVVVDEVGGFCISNYRC